LALAPVLTFSEHASAIVCTSPCVASGDKIVLATYWNASLGDNMAAASGESRQAAIAGGYAYVRNEALVFRNYKPGLIPLRLYYSAARGDYFTEASMAGQSDVWDLYAFVHLEGWIYPTQQPGTKPIYDFWSETRQDNMLAATQASIDDATGSGYMKVRIEGYVFPPP
jgi:hypothetical protein